MKTDHRVVSYLFDHMGGVVRDQILRCVDGTQDVRHLDLKNVETGHTLHRNTHRLSRSVSKVCVSAHRQVAGRPLQLFDALAQGAL